MESVRRKSLGPDGNQLIARANQKSIPLLWDRYESQLPLDGFAANGLTCHDCLYGPCRINPFGDKPTQGICGADRQQVVLQSIFQAVRTGVLESARELSFPAAREKAWEGLTLPDPHFADKSYLTLSLMNLLKLGNVQYQIAALASKAFPNKKKGQRHPPPQSLDLRTGANIFLEGGAPITLVERLLQGFRKEKSELRLLAGEGSEHLRRWGVWVVSLGHPELMLLTGGIDALVMHNQGREPFLANLAEQLGIKVFRAGTDSAGMAALTARKALEAFQSRVKRGADPFPPILQLPGEENTNKLLGQAKKVGALLKSKKLRGAAILLGEFNVKQTFFERTRTIIQKLLKEDVLVFIGGGLFASQPILESLIEPGIGKKLKAFLEELNESSPLFGFGSTYELPGVIEFLSSLDPRKGLKGIRTVAVFPEMHRWASVSWAFGLLSLGIPVQIGTRLPFWGSPELAEVLVKKLKGICRAEFLVAPSLAGPEEQAEEILHLL